MSHVPERILKKMRESIPERPQIQLVDDLNFPEPPKRNSSASTSATSRTPKRKPTGQLTATSNKTKRLSGNKPQPTQQPTPRLNNPRVRQVARVAKQAPTQVPNQVKPPKTITPTRSNRPPSFDYRPLRSVPLERTPAHRALQGQPKPPTEKRSLDRVVPNKHSDTDLKPAKKEYKDTDAQESKKRKREEDTEIKSKRSRPATDVKPTKIPQSESGKKKEALHSSTSQHPLSASSPRGSQSSSRSSSSSYSSNSSSSSASSSSSGSSSSSSGSSASSGSSGSSCSSSYSDDSAKS